jgi:excisionase family DNA binding protein
MVIPQPPEPTGTAPSRLAAPLLHGGNTPASAGKALRAVGGGKGHLPTVRVVAGRLGVSTATVYKLVAQGDLPHVRVSNAIRVAPADLDTFIARSRGQGGGRKERP